MPGPVFFKSLNIEDGNKENQVDDDGNPRSFAASRPRQIVLQLDEKMRHASGIIIQITIGRFPSLGVVQPKLFRLRLLGRSHRILEWNLRDGHELSLSELSLPEPHLPEPDLPERGLPERGLSVRHRSPASRCIPFSLG